MMRTGSYALDAKVHGLYGQRLKEKEREALTSLPSVRALQEFLAQRGISAFAQRPLSLLAFERTLEQVKEARENSLRHFMTRDEQRVFSAFLLDRELQALQIYLGILLRTDRRELVAYVERSAYVQTLHLSTDPRQTVGAYLKRLEDRPYYRVLEPYLNLSDAVFREREIYLSVNLSRWYYGNLLKELKKIPDPRKVLRHYFGEIIDLLNVQWIYRARRYRAMDVPEIQTMLMSGGRSLRESELRHWCEAPPDELERRLAQSRYRAILSEEGRLNYHLDLARHRYRAQAAHRLYRAPGGAFVHAIAYVDLLRSEQMDLIRIAEGISLGMPSREMQQFLIREEKGGAYGR